jgi:8-oxo-dGTP pyrophosphatase MutT (NUDIX family)
MQTHIVAKTLIFNDEGKLLRIRRSLDDAHRPGGADIPGGKVDDGEALVEGAVREIFEEVGIKVGPKSMQLVFSITKVGFNTEVHDDTNFVWLGFVTKLPKGQDVVLSFEHEEHDWYSIDEALKDNDSSTMTTFLNHLKTHNIAKDYWSK